MVSCDAGISPEASHSSPLFAAAMAARELVFLRIAADVKNIVDGIVRWAHVDNLANARLTVLVRRNDVASARRVLLTAVDSALRGRAVACLERAVVRAVRRAPQVIHTFRRHL